jgi:hypothetical protein
MFLSVALVVVFKMTVVILVLMKKAEHNIIVGFVIMVAHLLVRSTTADGISNDAGADINKGRCEYCSIGCDRDDKAMNTFSH